MPEKNRTPLYEAYSDTAKLVLFADWELPVRFSSIKEEHDVVRNSVGLFDVSHMGEIEISGMDAFSFLQYVTTNDVARLNIGDAQYTAFCYPDGGTVDDLVLYKLAEDNYLAVVNASNIDKNMAWLLQNKGHRKVITLNRSSDYAQIAVQGPSAKQVLQKLTTESLSEIAMFKFKKVLLGGKSVLLSRSGYTGEDGFEIYCTPKDATSIWSEVLSAGADYNILPCGLGARDTLRFEACLPLYGQELSATISPLEAGLGFIVNFDKGDFIGRDVLFNQKIHEPPRKLVGLEMLERGIPRTGYKLYSEGEEIGIVTTGTQSPTLNKGLGLALIAAKYAVIEDIVYVDIRGKRLKAKIIKKPFYKR